MAASEDIEELNSTITVPEELLGLGEEACQKQTIPKKHKYRLPGNASAWNPSYSNHVDEREAMCFKIIKPWEMFGIQVLNMPSCRRGLKGFASDIEFIEQLGVALNSCLESKQLDRGVKGNDLNEFLLRLGEEIEDWKAAGKKEKEVNEKSIFLIHAEREKAICEKNKVKEQQLLDFDRFFQSVSSLKRFMENAKTRVNPTENKAVDETLETELEQVVQRFLKCACEVEFVVTREKFGAVLYPKVEDCEKNHIVCEPDLEMTAAVRVITEGEKKKVYSSVATIMQVQVRRENTFDAMTQPSCLGHCTEGVNQHFCQLLTTIKGSIFSQNWNAVEIKRNDVYTPHSNVCTVFGMMVHGTKVQFTCLVLNKKNMLEIVRRSKKDRIEFDGPDRLPSSDRSLNKEAEKPGDAVNKEEKKQGKFYISEPFDLTDIYDFLSLKNHLDIFTYCNHIVLKKTI